MRSDLNDYECMLATSTCNIALQCSLSTSDGNDNENLESKIRKAWMQTVEQRALLRVKLVPKEGDFGVLGQRYKAVVVVETEESHNDDLISIKQYDDAPTEGLLPVLQRNGTSAMDLSKGSYFLDCRIVKGSPNNTVNVAFFLTLSHALSDGPGTLKVAHDFLQHLQEGYSGTESSVTMHDDLIDLQSLLLDSAYGKEMKERDCFPGVVDFKESLGATTTTEKKYLPPEALQKIPSDPGFGGPSKIDAISITLTKEQTAGLVAKAREFGGTIQGVISVVCLLTRLKLLHQDLPITCALQIPVNCRGSINDNNRVSKESCLCGSAGVWHTMDVDTLSLVSDLVAKASRDVKDAVEDNQHLEWLRRLMNEPASLPPYSLMVSSIGVAPLPQDTRDVILDDAVFFGGALANTTAPSQAQSTMTHVTTFGGKLELTLSFTHPGVSLSFARDTTCAIETLLVAMAGGTLDGVTCGDLLAEASMQWTTAISK